MSFHQFHADLGTLILIDDAAMDDASRESLRSISRYHKRQGYIAIEIRIVRGPSAVACNPGAGLWWQKQSHRARGLRLYLPASIYKDCRRDRPELDPIPLRPAVRPCWRASVQCALRNGLPRLANALHLRPLARPADVRRRSA